jgi:D-amino peptidase
MGKKIYISVDFEGVACVVDSRHAHSSEDPLHKAAQRLVTGEANAAIEGALAGGATEILLNDAHGGGLSMLHEQIHPEARILLGGTRPRRFPGLDGSFAGVMLVGYHPMAGTTKGVLSHTFSSASIQRMWLNNREIGEMAFDGACAGELGVPVVLVTSCAAGCREAVDFFGDVETVATKEGISRDAAISLSPAKSRERIRAAAQRACERIGDFEPFRVGPPVTKKVEYKLEQTVDAITRKRGGVERLGPRTVQFTADSVFETLWPC